MRAKTSITPRYKNALCRFTNLQQNLKTIKIRNSTIEYTNGELLKSNSFDIFRI